MLNKIMLGRLGNQMFQYATMRAYQLEYAKDEPINLVFSRVYKEGTKEDGFYNQLEQFNISQHYVDKKIHLNFKQILLLTKYLITCRVIKIVSKKKDYNLKKRNYEIKQQENLQKAGLFLFSFGYCQLTESKVQDKLFMGHYESSNFFNNFKKTLQKEFTPIHDKLPKNSSLYSTIQNTNSVCISIRRGDFLAPEHKAQHYICTPEYFREAITLIQQHVKNPQFIVFSDDINCVKENMQFPKNTKFEHGDDPVWEKLRLMYSCKHFIISNSTFSWWAQYLSRNENKIVVAPKRWENFYSTPDIYEQDWLLLDSPIRNQ